MEDQIASAVLAEGGQFPGFQKVPSAAISLLDLHGANDTTMPANLSESAGLGPHGSLLSSDRFYYLPLQRISDAWAKSGCEAGILPYQPQHNLSMQNLPIACYQRRCSQKKLAYCTGAWNHRWPLYNQNKWAYATIVLTFVLQSIWLPALAPLAICSRSARTS